MKNLILQAIENEIQQEECEFSFWINHHWHNWHNWHNWSNWGNWWNHHHHHHVEGGNPQE